MAHYVLSGGCAWTAPGNGKDYCDTIYSFLPKGAHTAKLLICLFAQPPAKWPEKIVDPLRMLREHVPAHLTIEILVADPYTFLEQVAEADIVYLCGGFTPLLLKALSVYNLSPQQWRDAFGEKVVVGTSAGTSALTTFSVNVDTETPQEGLGILDLATLVHYGSTSYLSAENVQVDWPTIEAAFTKGCEEHGITEEKQLLIPEAEFVAVS
ncbi:hypothetical protein BH11PAT4_BH11PAT4_0950 [soil metagenome]